MNLTMEPYTNSMLPYTGEYDDSCVAHGEVVYRRDLERYLLGLPIVD